MKFRETVRYEITYQLRRPATWIYFVALLALFFQFTTEAQIADARRGDTPVNAPLVLAVGLLFGSIMALLPIAAVAGEAAARDVHTGMTALVYTTPVSRTTYLGGRFTAALALAALLLLAIPLGLLLAVLASDVGAELLGPVRLAYYAAAYLFVALPNAIIAASFAFAAASLSRRHMTAFVGVAALFIGMVLCMTVLGLRFNLWTLASLLDPLGVTTLSMLSRGWSPIEQRTLFPQLEASFLLNRALWLGLAMAVLAITHRRFRFAHHVQGAGRRRRRSTVAVPDLPAVALPQAGRDTRVAAAMPVRRDFGRATRARQLAAIVRESYRVAALGWGGLVMLVLAALVVVFGVEMMEHIGVPLVPVTAHIAAYLAAPGELLTLLPPLLIAYYAGELVWRDRDAGLGEIAGAAPVPDWVYVLGRAGGLALAMVTMQALMMLAAIAVQLRMGHYDIQPWLHLRLFLGLYLADHLLFVALAVVAHVVVAHKFAGHGVVLLAYAFVAFAARLGIEHRLLVFAGDPGWSYTDMRGFAGSVGPWLVLQLYWAAWAALLLVAATLLWVRGRESGTPARLRLARSRLTRRAIAVASGAAALVLALGGFTWYNTHVLNEYRTEGERTTAAAEYERRYRRFAYAPQPLLDGIRLHADLRPSRGTAEVRVSYRLVHRGTGPIDSIHVTTHPSVVTSALVSSRASTLALSDDALGFRILALREPMQPGDTLTLGFTLRVGKPGFANDGVDDIVTANGTFLRNSRFPAIGYLPDRELSDAGVRTDEGLPPRARVPSLDDSTMRHAVARARAEQITFEAVVGTDEGQLAVAPGALRRTWTEGGRRWFEYATDQRIRNDFALFSANYAVHRGRWNDVELEIVHHPEHASNVAGMLAGVRASLEHLTTELGPYRHRQLRMVEHPGRTPTLHAFPVNVSFEEGYALMNPARDERGLDFPFAIAAHEIAHHWWGDQLMAAPVEGGAVLSESLAWYSAMGVVEYAKGRAELDRLMSLMREAWLPPRAPSDPPLLRAGGWFLAYRKGPLAMYALREYVGAAPVNEALRRLLAANAGGRPPLPTTRDLYRELETATPDSLRYLLADLFAENTAWELATDSVRAEAAPGGMQQLALHVRARKIVIDTAGVQREVPMNDLIEIGAFADAAGGEEEERGAIVYRAMHRVRTGAQRIVITVPETARWAGVDPRRLLFDLDAGNNEARVGAKAGGMRFSRGADESPRAANAGARVTVARR